MNQAVRYEPEPIMRWICSALMPFLLVSIRYRTLNQSEQLDSSCSRRRCRPITEKRYGARRFAPHFCALTQVNGRVLCA